MLAIQAMADPETLTTTDRLWIDDPESGERREYTRADLMRCVSDYSEVVIFFSDLERGIIHLSLHEYLTIPAPFAEGWRLFRKVQGVLQEEQKRRALAKNRRF